MYLLFADYTFSVRESNPVAAQAAMNVLNQSPYDGTIFNAWGLNRNIHSSPGCLEWVKELDLGSKHLWPETQWDEMSIPSETQATLDLGNSEGRIDYWLAQWRESLRIAREIGSPGIIFDPETYIDVMLHYIPYVVAANGISETALKTQLQAIGSEMCDIIDEEHPTVWIVDLGGNTSAWTDTCSYWIAKGILDRAKVRGSQFIWYAAGHGISYYQTDTAEFATEIASGFTRAAPYLAEWPNLRCSAPIMLFDGITSTSGYIREQLELKAPLEFASVYDFLPVLTLYGENFDIAWFYREPSTGYSDDPAVIATFNNLLRHAKYRPRIVEHQGHPEVYDTTAALAAFDANLQNGRFVAQAELEA